MVFDSAHGYDKIDGDYTELSINQENIWFLHELYGGNSSYNIVNFYAIDGKINKDILEKSLNLIIQQQESLRTVFINDNGKLMAQIRPELHIEVGYHDIDQQDYEHDIHSIMKEEAFYTFDLSKGPLIKVLLIKNKNMSDRYTLGIIMHHIISDGYSMVLFLETLVTYYQLLDKGLSIPNNILTYQYRDYVVDQRKAVSKMEKERRFWLKSLQDKQFHLDIAQHSQRKNKVGIGKKMRFHIDREIVNAVKTICNKKRITPFMFYLTAFYIVLYKHTNQKSICVGTPMANRHIQGTEKSIGCFINTLPLAINLEDSYSFDQLLDKVSIMCMDCYQYQSYPFESILKDFNVYRDSHRHPIFQVMFVYQNFINHNIILDNFRVEGIHLKQEETKFDLTLEIYDDKDEVDGTIIYNESIMNVDNAQSYVHHYMNILEEVTSDSKILLHKINILDHEELECLHRLNDTKTDPGCNLLVPTIIEKRALHCPKRPALIYEGCVMTYGDFNKKVNQLANYLIKKGMQVETPIGISMTRSFDMLVGIHAVVRAGGVYVPIEPSLPSLRKQVISQDANIDILLTREEDYTENWTTMEIILLDSIIESLENEDDSSIDVTISPDNLCYIIYTSGTSGQPKGVGNVHKGLLNRLLWMQKVFQLTETDAVIQKTPYSFDVSVWEFFWPLMIGATLVIAKPEGHKDVDYLMDIIKKNHVTTMHFVPSMLDMFLETYDSKRCSTLRDIICSGEALSRRLVDKFYALSKGRIHNLYGPTEASIDVTYWLCQRDSEGDVPIGRPIDNTKIHILDQHLNPLPQGVAGNIYIESIGLARGYMNKVELTAKKFFMHSIEDQEVLLYDTGDVGYIQDGNIMYVGRRDNQLKIRGNRVELDEIVTIMLHNKRIKNAYVQGVKNERGHINLIGFIVPRDPEDIIPCDPIIEYLRCRLPSYMMLTHIIQISSIPLTANGKIDHKRLMTYVTERDITESHVEPRTSLEQRLHDIWVEVLNIPKISIYDSFFKLGGDSLLSIKISSIAKQRGLAIHVKDLYDNQTIASLAQMVSEEIIQPEYDNIVLNQDIPLTPIQLHYLLRHHENVVHYNHVLICDVDQSITYRDIHSCLDKVVSLHDVFRYGFIYEDEVWKQKVLRDDRLYTLVNITLDVMPDEEENSYIQDVIHMNQIEHSLEAAPQFRGIFIETPHARDNYLIFIIHHLYIDGYSWHILLEQMNKLLHKNEENTIKTIPYRQWAREIEKYPIQDNIKTYLWNWCKSIMDNVKSWDTLLENHEERYTYEDMHKINCSLDKEYTHKLFAVCQRNRVRVDAFILQIISKLILQKHGDMNLLVDFETLGRKQTFTEINLADTVGWFTAIAPMDFTRHMIDNLHAFSEHIQNRVKYTSDFNIYQYKNRDDELYTIMAELPRRKILFNYLGAVANKPMNNNKICVSTRINHDLLDRSKRHTAYYLYEFNVVVMDQALQIEVIFNHKLIDSSYLERLRQVFEDEIDILHNKRSHQFLYESIDGITINSDVLARIQERHKNIENIYPLSPLQEMMTNYYLRNSKNGMNAQVISWDIQGEMSIPLLRQSFKTLMDEYEILRTTFEWRRLEQQMQVVHHTYPFLFYSIDLSSLDKHKKNKVIQDLITAWNRTGFIITKAPQTKFCIIKLEDNCYKLIWKYLVSLFDNTSWLVLMSRLRHIYTSLKSGVEYKPVRNTDFSDYIKYTYEQDNQKISSFWKNYLSGYEDNGIGITRISNESNNNMNSKLNKVTQIIDEDKMESIVDYCGTVGIHIAVLFQAAWVMTLSEITHTDDVLYSIVSYGRMIDMEDADSIVGPLANNIPIRVKLDREQGLEHFLRQVQMNIYEAQKNDCYNIHQIISRSQLNRSVILNAIDERMLVYTTDTNEEMVSELDNMRFCNFNNSITINVPMRLYIKKDKVTDMTIKYNALLYKEENMVSIINRLKHYVYSFINS